MSSARRENSADEAEYHRLNNGDCMLRSAFHSAYSRMPQNYRAELIAGIVFEPSPVSFVHGEHHSELIYLLSSYARNTPGTQIASDTTVILGEEDEVQPDVLLRIATHCGGQSNLTDSNFVSGAPELVAEIAYSSRAIDLHLKKKRYEIAGVREYVVVCLQPKRAYWFSFANSRQILPIGGTFQSEIFPGLWISNDGLLNLDQKLTTDTLAKGLQTAEHKAFLEDLQRRHTKFS